MIRVAINGYGRIGRVAHRVILEKHLDEVEIVGINAGHSTDIKGWMYLLKYDTNYHTLSSKFIIQNSKLEDSEKTGIYKDCIGFLHINQSKIPVFSQKIVDRTGAGDAYLALSSLCVAKGLPMDLAGFIGNAAGALKVSTVCNRTPVEPAALYKFVTAMLR